MKTTTLNRPETGTATIVKRPAAARGQTELGWLHSRHTFSFGNYFDPDNMGFRSLRVINDDVVEAGGGFGQHPHRDAALQNYAGLLKEMGKGEADIRATLASLMTEGV